MPFLSEFNSGGGAPGYRLRLITGKFIDDNPDPVAIRDFTVQNGNFMVTTTDSKVYIGRSVNRLERAFTDNGNFGDFVNANQVTRDIFIGGDPYGSQFSSAIGVWSSATQISANVREYDTNNNYYDNAIGNITTNGISTINNEDLGVVSRFIVSSTGRLFYVNTNEPSSGNKNLLIYEWDSASYSFVLATFTNNSGSTIGTATDGSSGNPFPITVNFTDIATSLERSGDSLIMFFSISGTMYKLEISGTDEPVVTSMLIEPSSSISAFSGTYNLAVTEDPTNIRALLTKKRTSSSGYLYFDGNSWRNITTDTLTKPLYIFREAAYSSASGRFYTISNSTPNITPGAIHWTTTPDIVDSWQPDTTTDIKMCYYLRNDSGTAYASTGATAKIPTTNQEVLSAPTECLIQKLT